MYFNPQVIWVTGLVRQSVPTTSILVAGSACAIPWAPEVLLRAW